MIGEELSHGMPHPYRGSTWDDPRDKWILV